MLHYYPCHGHCGLFVQRVEAGDGPILVGTSRKMLLGDHYCPTPDHPVWHFVNSVHNFPHSIFEERVGLRESLVPEPMDLIRPRGIPACHSLYCQVPFAVSAHMWGFRPVLCPPFLLFFFQSLQSRVPEVILPPLLPYSPPKLPYFLYTCEVHVSLLFP